MLSLGKKKQVLLVGNDGIQLFVINGKRVTMAGDFSQSGDNLVADLKAAFKQTKYPLTLLFDVVEQQYRKEVIPGVGFMDKAKVIKRKLAIAFPQLQMRAYMPLKSASKKDTTALFAGLAITPVVGQVLEAIRTSAVAIQGAGLLPLESTSLVIKLAQEAHKKNNIAIKSRWSILMTLHKTGGLRQVVIKDDELALTRLTPMAIDADNTEAVAAEMAREFSATLTYLSRFGYVPADGLDLIVVSSDDVCRNLVTQRLPVQHFFSMNLQEASQMAGFNAMMGQDISAYSDILHAGWVCAQNKLTVPLSTPMLDRVRNARQGAQLGIIALIFGAGYLGWQVFSLQTANINLNSEVTSLKQRQIILQRDHDTLAKSLNTLKYDPEQVNKALKVYNEYNDKQLDIEPVFALINEAIDKDTTRLQSLLLEALKQDSLAVGQTQQTQTPAAPPGMPGMPGAMEQAATEPAKPKPPARIVMKLGFSTKLTIEEAARLTNDLADNLKKKLPGWKVDVTEIIGNLSLDKTVQGVSEQVAKGKVEGRMVSNETSSLVLEGPLP